MTKKETYSLSFWTFTASPCCPDPYQVYVTNEVISPCQHDFCVTYLSGDGSRCYDGRLAKPAPGDGCKCKEGYAIIADNRCGKAGSCACPAIADRRDPRFFSNYECQDLWMKWIVIEWTHYFMNTENNVKNAFSSEIFMNKLHGDVLEACNTNSNRNARLVFFLFFCSCHLTEY